MTTWPDVQKHMRSRFRLGDDRPDTLSMIWSYDGGRSQKIIVRRFKAFDREMLEFKSAFATIEDVDAETLLRSNAELPMATVALAGETYMVVYNVLLENLVMDDFDLCLSRIAAVADTLEEKHGRRDAF